MGGRISILLASLITLFAIRSHALTRAEIIERFRATPVVQVDGLVQVLADCPAAVRREFQLPVAGYAAGVCRSLYAAENRKPVRFGEPGIVIRLGGETNAVTNVVSLIDVRADGRQYTKIFLPSPAHSDRHALTLATARAYFLAVHGREVSDRDAWRALIASSPELRAAETCGQIEDWAVRGIYADGMDDEEYLKLARRVLLPGRLTRHEYANFVSRLCLYPLSYDAPFCGKYRSLDFRTAIRVRRHDLGIRFAAIVKAKQILIFGAGRGEGLQAAADAYSLFLSELGRDEKTDGELLALLVTAEDKLRCCAP